MHYTMSLLLNTLCNLQWSFITIDELSQACREFGLDDVHLEDMIKDIDQNNVSPFYVYSLHLHFLARYKIAR